MAKAAPTPARRATPTPPADAAPQRKRKMRVRATQLGWYGEVRRREGDVFTLKDADKEFSPKWMEEVDPRTPENVTTGKEALRKFHDETMRGRMPQRGTDVVSDEDDNDNPLHG